MLGDVAVGHPAAGVRDVEQDVDGLALFTKAIEIVGLFAAGARLRPTLVITHLQPKGSLT